MNIGIFEKHYQKWIHDWRCYSKMITWHDPVTVYASKVGTYYFLSRYIFLYPGGRAYVDISVCVLIDEYKAIYRERIERVRFFISFAWMAIDAHFRPISITLGWTNEPWYHRTNIIFVDSFVAFLCYKQITRLAFNPIQLNRIYVYCILM